MLPKKPHHVVDISLYNIEICKFAIHHLQFSLKSNLYKDLSNNNNLLQKKIVNKITKAYYLCKKILVTHIKFKLKTLF